MTMIDRAGHPFQDQVLAFKRHLIATVLEDCHGNRTQAARRLGVNRTYLQRLIRDLGLKEPPPAEEGRR